MSQELCCNLDDFLRAMADKTRQRILALLCDHEMSVYELCQNLTVTQPTVSHHLALLRWAKLVIPRREGKQVYYRINPGCVAECCDEIMTQFNLIVQEED